jgi:hypothetical protein
MIIRELAENDFESMVMLLGQLGYGDNNVQSLSERYVVFKKHEGIVFVVEDDEKK